MTFAERLFAVLAEKRRELGGQIPREVWLAVVNAFAEAEGVVKKTRRKAAQPAPRARDAIFDALAKLDGQDVAQITRQGASRIAGAKKQILEVMPNASTEQIIDEITRRAAAYRRKHPTRELTAMALVTWWAELGGGPMTKQAVIDPYIEPSTDWRPILAQVLNVEADHEYISRAWADVDLSYRRAVLTKLSEKVVPISQGVGWWSKEA